MSAKTKSRRNQAFTLLELLVVIAIIALLAALSLPALRRAKLAAKAAACRNNLRQLGTGLRLYVDEFEKYPMYPSPLNTVDGWEHDILTYCGADPGHSLSPRLSRSYGA